MRGAVVAAVNVVLWWGLLFVLYVVLISSVTPLELMVGAGFALLGAAAAEALRRAEHPRPLTGSRIASAAAAFPLTLLRETGTLAGAVAAALTGRQDGGRTVTVRLAPGTDAALAAALLSASPGACVIDITAPGDIADTTGQESGAAAGGPAAAGGGAVGPGAGTGPDGPPDTGEGPGPGGGTLSAPARGGAEQGGTGPEPDPRGPARRGGPASGPDDPDSPGPGGGVAPGRPGAGQPGETPATGHELTVHLLGDGISLVERALGGRRLR